MRARKLLEVREKRIDERLQAALQLFYRICTDLNPESFTKHEIIQEFGKVSEAEQGSKNLSRKQSDIEVARALDILVEHGYIVGDYEGNYMVTEQGRTLEPEG